ncbi:MAG TPA: PQQ-binding-like beta-propeller repeat protein [Vicinamibacteria bacterium]|nr:PQQ-binding-like beta-propeller repeat protein [Vicinamibacteria bacterium]
MQYARILTTVLSCWLAAGVAAAAGDVRLLPVEGEGASYWPRWRGPSGQGYVNSTGYPDRWSDQENVAWKVSVPGQGNSSPIIWGDHIFLTTAHDGGKRLSLIAFRRSDGSLLWETAVPQQGVEHAHEKNGHASATPVTDGKTVYASFGTQGLVAVDFEGKLLWQQRVGTLDNYHGSAGSPILYRNSVILYQDHQGESFVAAFDKSTGELLWRTGRDAQTGWGTPIVLSTGNRDELIVSSQHAVHAYDPANGALYWSATGNKFEVIPTPVVGHGLVFCSSGRAGPTLAIRPGGSGDVTGTNVVWSSPKGSPFVPSPIIVGEYLYMVNDMVSVVTGYEAKTGKVVFQGRLGLAEKESFSASPVTVDGKIFFTNDNGETFVLEAGPEFRLLHVNRLGARTLASPALVEGRWYFRTESELIAIGSS